MMQESSFWSGRPSPQRALVTALLVAALGGAVALVATRVSSFSVRSHLELSGAGTDEFFLTPMAHDPARVQVTTRRENSTWTRDQASMAGDPYWVRRYGDPARPGLPQRILLSSRSRGAHLFVPLGALDLERDLAELESTEAPAEGQPSLRCSLAQVFWSRSFSGLFLHLRFPERPLYTKGSDEGKGIDFDLLIVRGNELLTTDFLLQPNAELYRALLADGRMPPGPYRRNPRCDELVQMLRTEPADTGVPLYSPISLFDELRLCWGAELPHVLDDRWRPEEAPAYAVHPPSPETRERLGRLGTQHLAARFEDESERASLARALASFSGS